MKQFLRTAQRSTKSFPTPNFQFQSQYNSLGSKSPILFYTATQQVSLPFFSKLFMSTTSTDSSQSTAQPNQSIQPIHLTSRNFQSDVIEAPENQRIIVKFEAEWCTSCKQLKPRLETLLQRVNALFSVPPLRLATVDVDEEDELPNAFGLQSLPTLYAMNKDQVTDSLIGGTQIQDEKILIFLLKSLVKLDEKKKLFYIDFGLDRAVLTYEFTKNEEDKPVHVSYTHVIAPASVRGNNVGDALAHVAFEYAQERGWIVKPVCPWLVKKFITDEKNRKLYDKVLLKE